MAKTKKVFKVGCSVLSNTIYAGYIKMDKDSGMGLWEPGKQDVTDSAPRAVAEFLLMRKEKLVFTHNGKKYELKVSEISSTVDKYPHKQQ